MNKSNNKNSVSLAMHEVEIVYKRPLFDTMPIIRGSSDANDLLRKLIKPETMDYKEHFWILLLNKANRVMGFSEIARGSSDSVQVDIKEIFQLVLIMNASSIIVSHNHPSGNLTASKSDISMTNQIDQVAKLFMVQLLDHIILTSEDYYSFSDENEMPTASNNALPF